MSRRVQRPPSHGRGYSVREVTSVGAAIGPLPNRPPPAAAPRACSGPPGVSRPAAGASADARSWSIGAATRALATSVSRPIWLCHQPLHAIAPSQKLVYVEL